MGSIVGPVALAFPGAFVHPAGPEESFRQAHPSVFEPILETASRVAGTDLRRIPVSGIAGLEECARQVFLQAFAIAVAAVFRDRGLSVVGTLGHSLGVYGAVVASGALDPHDGLVLVREACRLVGEAYRENPQGMLGLVGLSEEEVQGLCREKEFRVVLVNAPLSLVVAGSPGDLRELAARALEAGALKVMMLEETVAYHHPDRLGGAARHLAGIASEIRWRAPKVPIFSAVDGQEVRTADAAREMILRNLHTPIRWPLAVAAARAAAGFVECGVGTSLGAVFRMIDDARPWWGPRQWKDG